MQAHPTWRRIDLYDLVLGGSLSRRGEPVSTVLGAMRAAPTVRGLGERLKLWHVTLGSDTQLRLLAVKHSAVQQCSNGDTGLRLWPLALSLSQFLIDEKPELIRGRRCIELGAGVGALTAACAVLKPTTMHSTELSRRCRKLIALNCGLNQCDRSLIHVSSLRFGSKKGQDWLHETGEAVFDTVVGCEIVYEMETIAPLWACIRQLLAPVMGTFVLGYYERFGPQMTKYMLETASCAGFDWEVVQLSNNRERVIGMLGPSAKETWSSDFLDSWQDDKFFIYIFKWKSRPREVADSMADSPKRTSVQRLQDIIMEHNQWNATLRTSSITELQSPCNEYTCSL